MKNRRFRGDRLYKLAKIIVIVLTVYFAFNAIDYYSRLGAVQTGRKSCASDKYYIECLRNSSIILNNVEKGIRNNAYIAILLPTLFFGGTILYRYLFPETEGVTLPEMSDS